MLFIYAIAGLVVGAIIGYIVRQSIASKKIGSAETKAERILEDAKNKEKEMLIEAKQGALEITEQAKKTEADFRMKNFEEKYFLGIYSGRVNADSDLGFVWKSSSIEELIAHINTSSYFPTHIFLK